MVTTRKQKDLFIKALIEQDGKNATEALRKAGAVGNRNRNAAYNKACMLKKELTDSGQLKAFFDKDLPLKRVSAIVTEIAEGSVKDESRLKAVDMRLKYAGISPATTPVSVSGNVSFVLADLAKMAGLAEGDDGATTGRREGDDV
jgi:hypothetical protein